MTKLKGLNFKRIEKVDYVNFKEAAFSEVINEEFTKNPRILEQLTGIQHAKGDKHLSEREEEIVIATIQWLGSNVGQTFLDDVSKRIDKFEKLNRSIKSYPLENDSYTH